MLEIDDIDAIREWEESQYIAGSDNKFNEVKEYQVEVIWIRSKSKNINFLLKRLLVSHYYIIFRKSLADVELAKEQSTVSLGRDIPRELYHCLNEFFPRQLFSEARTRGSL